MSKFLNSVLVLLFALAGVALLVLASAAEPNVSFLGIGLILVAVLSQIGLVATQQREQTELLAVIAEASRRDAS